MKIPTTYFYDSSKAKYHLWAADRFTMYALVELAGRDHTKYLDQIMYFYNQPDDEKRAKKDCTVA